MRKTRRVRKISSQKLTEYAKQGRGKNAFVPRKKKRDILQERIDRVVAKALRAAPAAGAGYDVVRHNPQRLRFHGAHKLG